MLMFACISDFCNTNFLKHFVQAIWCFKAIIHEVCGLDSGWGYRYLLQRCTTIERNFQTDWLEGGGEGLRKKKPEIIDVI